MKADTSILPLPLWVLLHLISESLLLGLNVAAGHPTYLLNGTQYRDTIRGTREPAARPVMVPEATAASPDTRPIEPTPSAAMPARLEAPARVRMARVNRQPEGR